MDRPQPRLSKSCGKTDRDRGRADAHLATRTWLRLRCVAAYARSMAAEDEPRRAFSPPDPPLSDGRTRLRLPVAYDEQAVLEACQDPEIQRWVPIPVPYRRQHAHEWIAETAGGWSERRHGALAIADRPMTASSVRSASSRSGNVERASATGSCPGAWARHRDRCGSVAGPLGPPSVGPQAARALSLRRQRRIRPRCGEGRFPARGHSSGVCRDAWSAA